MTDCDHSWRLWESKQYYVDLPDPDAKPIKGWFGRIRWPMNVHHGRIDQFYCVHCTDVKRVIRLSPMWDEADWWVQDESATQVNHQVQRLFEVQAMIREKSPSPYFDRG